MIELVPGKYDRVVPLLDRIPFNNLFARVVVERKVRGRILVDNESAPTVCLIIHKYGMSFLSGGFENSLFNGELVTILKGAQSGDIRAKWMLAWPEDWNHKLAVLLGKGLMIVSDDSFDATVQEDKVHVLQTERVNFKFHRELYPGRIPVPDGCALKRVDSEMYERLSGSVVPQYFWDSFQEFWRNGIGFSLVSGEQIVSTCFSSFVVDGKLELGIETGRAFRRRGYSIYPARALMEHCLANGYEPIWACRKGNVGSFKLALKLGFTPLSSHPYYFLPGG
jgi:RimJ/RimL family protein N-acetyltransferase